jgi:hypothetical protein
MKNILKAVVVTSILVATIGSATADSQVQGYITSNGTYVALHVRTSPNATRLDNYSTQGNYNPYNGNAGTQPRFKPYQ